MRGIIHTTTDLNVYTQNERLLGQQAERVLVSRSKIAYFDLYRRNFMPLF